jgi:hypothetical protein
MNDQIQYDYQQLHACAINLATRMLAQMSDEKQSALYAAVDAGAVCLMQLGPLPACERIELVLQGRTGKREVIASVSEACEMH